MPKMLDRQRRPAHSQAGSPASEKPATVTDSGFRHILFVLRDVSQLQQALLAAVAKVAGRPRGQSPFRTTQRADGDLKFHRPNVQAVLLRPCRRGPNLALTT